MSASNTPAANSRGSNTPAANTTHPPAAKIIRMRALTERIGLSKSEIYRRLAANRFPKAISLGARARGWRVSDIDAWLDSLQQENS